MKPILKKTTFLFFLTITFLVNISTNKSNWSGMDLKPIEIENSIHFQQMRGSTRVGEFENLSSTLKRFINSKYQSKYLTNILGTPNNIFINQSTNQEIHYYFLSDNPKKYPLKLTIKNKMLVSYLIEK